MSSRVNTIDCLTIEADEVTRTRRMEEESTVKKAFGFIYEVLVYTFLLIFGLLKLLATNIMKVLKTEETSSPQFVNDSSRLEKEKELLHPCEEKLKKLEAMVAELSSKPSRIPQEKDEMLVESMNRIRCMEYDLQKTKKVRIFLGYMDEGIHVFFFFLFN